MVNFGLLTAEICCRVWGTPANFNGFRVLAALGLLHGTLVVGVSQTLQTYIRQGGHHIGHWPTFLVSFNFIDEQSPVFDAFSTHCVCRYEHNNTTDDSGDTWGVRFLISQFSARSDSTIVFFLTPCSNVVRYSN